MTDSASSVVRLLDIWIFDFDALEVEEGVLSDKEKTKADGYIKKNDQINYQLSHIYLRKTLSHYAPKIQAKEWVFITNEFGRPSLISEQFFGLHFNISHNDEYFCIIISSVEQCGIDVETVKPIDLDEHLLDMIFSKNEKKRLIDAQKDLTVFYKCWTLKEAHLKALGKGLSIQPNQISFEEPIHHFNEEGFYFCEDEKNHYWVQSLKNNSIVSFTVLNSLYLAPKFCAIDQL